MKKEDKAKKYFLYSSIIQIIVSIVSVIFIKEYLKYIISSYENLALDDSSFLSSVKMFETNGKVIVILLALITSVLNGIVIYRIFKKKDFQTINIISSFISFFINESNIISILGLLNLFIIWNTKDNNSKVKKEIKVPKIKKLVYERSATLIGILSIMIYFLLPELIAFLPWGFIGKSICLDLLLIIISYFLFKREIDNSFKVIKNKFKECFKYVMNKQWLAWGIYLLAAIVVTIIMGDNSTSVNQQLAESLPMLYVIPSCLIYAPFVEELVFRAGIRRLIKNNKIFIIVSGLSFGLLHTLSEKTLINFIVLSLPYSVLGCYFAYLYVKTDNIGASMMGHFLHNALASIMMILI